MLMTDRHTDERELLTLSRDDELGSQTTEARCWGYDIRRLDDPTNHRPLSYVAYLALSQLGCVRQLDLDTRKLGNFLSSIEHSMPDGNPYHNRLHVAGVVQHMFVQLSSMHIDDPVVNCACVIAAVVHDCMHPGVSADRWREIDPDSLPAGTSLEQYHLDSAVSLMTRPANNFLSDVAPEVTRELQGLVSELVLATDMSKHAQVMTDVQRASSACRSESRPIWLFRLLMKVADLHHCVGSTASHLCWVKNLYAEIHGERADELPPSFSCDQLQFFDKVVLPMVDTLVAICPVTAPACRLARINRSLWL